jgi:hypothetical protein
VEVELETPKSVVLKVPGKFGKPWKTGFTPWVQGVVVVNPEAIGNGKSIDELGVTNYNTTVLQLVVLWGAAMSLNGLGDRDRDGWSKGF